MHLMISHKFIEHDFSNLYFSGKLKFVNLTNCNTFFLITIKRIFKTRLTRGGVIVGPVKGGGRLILFIK